MIQHYLTNFNILNKFNYPYRTYLDNEHFVMEWVLLILIHEMI